MKILTFLLLYFFTLLLPAWSAQEVKPPPPPATPAKGHKRVVFSVSRAGWPANSLILIEIIQNGKVICSATTVGGVILGDDKKPGLQTSIACSLLNDTDAAEPKVTLLSGDPIGTLNSKTATK